MPRRRPRGPVLAAAAALLAAWLLVAAWLVFRWGGAPAVRALDDLGELVAAALAAVLTGAAAVRSTGRLRWSWAAAAIATGSWAAGETVWSCYEMLWHRATPFPSWADVGYLIFPVAAAVGLWLHPAAGVGGDRLRRALDGLIVAGALSLVSWSTALGAVVHAGGDSHFAFAVSLAYPIGDIVLLTMTITTIGRAGSARGALGLLGLGFIAMTVADSAFAYLTAVGSYHSGMLTDTGWFAAFELMAMAGLVAAVRSPSSEQNQTRATSSMSASLPVYVVLGTALAIVVFRQLSGHAIDSTGALIAAITITGVLVRQYTALRDNLQLARALAARESQLQHQAFHDGLTGLANRALFADRVAHALELHQRHLRSVAVLFCDLDDFKFVNDGLGHAAGDELLVQVAARLRGCLRTADTLARLGGDEFAMLIEEGGDAPDAVGRRVLATLQEPFTIAGQSLRVGVSVGVALLTADMASLDAATLLAHADVAMYSAKGQGKGRLAVYQHGMSLPGHQDEKAQAALALAIERGHIDLHYQPIVNLQSGKVHGFEALARWTHNDRPVPPAEFIPLAERTGLIRPLTAHVLQAACSQLARWSAAHSDPQLRIGVNISAGLMTDPDFPDLVRRVLEEHALQPGQLVLELTESALLTDLDTAKAVATALRDHGARLSLDDFGTGYSSLAHLQHIPLDSIKLDRAFTADLGSNPDTARFTSAFVRLAADLGLMLVVEGIEHAEQLHELRRLGCTLGQGYLLARPAPAAAFDEFRGLPSGRPVG